MGVSLSIVLASVARKQRRLRRERLFSLRGLRTSCFRVVNSDFSINFILSPITFNGVGLFFVLPHQ